jgi:acyl carrier protein
MIKMSEEAIHSIVQDAIRVTFGCPDVVVTRETQADDIDGWDSLSHGILLLRLEASLKHKLAYSELYDLADVGALIDYIRKLHV